jgi:hypothetical protein
LDPEREAAKPRISYYPVDRLEDPEMRGYLDCSARFGTPCPRSQAVPAHVPAVLRSFSPVIERRRAVTPRRGSGRNAFDLPRCMAA